MTWRSWLVWAAIGAVLALLYLPLVPPFFFSLLPETAAEPAPTLRWYVEMWRNPLLTGAVVTSMEAAVIVALTTPLLALVAAISIRELKLPRLILGLMLLPLLVPGVSMGIAVAFFFKQIGIAPSLGTIVIVQDSLGLAVRASGRVDGHVDVRSGPNRGSAYERCRSMARLPGHRAATHLARRLGRRHLLVHPLVQ